MPPEGVWENILDRLVPSRLQLILRNRPIHRLSRNCHIAVLCCKQGITSVRAMCLTHGGLAVRHFRGADHDRVLLLSCLPFLL